MFMVASVIRGRWFDPLKRTFELKITSSELKTLNSFEIQSEVIPDFFFNISMPLSSIVQPA